MSHLRQEWLDTFAKLFAASCGVSLGGQSDVLPYSPAMLEAMSQSDKG